MSDASVFDDDDENLPTFVVEFGYSVVVWAKDIDEAREAGWRELEGRKLRASDLEIVQILPAQV